MKAQTDAQQLAFLKPGNSVVPSYHESNVKLRSEAQKVCANVP